MVTSIEKVQQAILKRVNRHGIEATQSYIEALPALSVERHRLGRVLGNLMQDTTTGEWFFKK